MKRLGRTQYQSDDDFTRGTDWDDKRTRRRFISKVLIIISFQMAVTTGCTIGVLNWKTAKDIFLKNRMFVYIGMGGMLACSLLIYCCRGVARKVPLNYFLLFLYTIFSTMLVCAVTVYYHINMILAAVGSTVLICIGLTIFALCFPCDFTGYGSYLCVAGLVVFALGIVACLVKNTILRWIYLSLGLLVFSLYLVYDIQLMTGRYSNQYSEEDYIIAALSIYSDIVRIFRLVLQIIGQANKS